MMITESIENTINWMFVEVFYNCIVSKAISFAYYFNHRKWFLLKRFFVIETISTINASKEFEILI